VLGGEGGAIVSCSEERHGRRVMLRGEARPLRSAGARPPCHARRRGAAAEISRGGAAAEIRRGGTATEIRWGAWQPRPTAGGSPCVPRSLVRVAPYAAATGAVLPAHAARCGGARGPPPQAGLAHAPSPPCQAGVEGTGNRGDRGEREGWATDERGGRVREKDGCGDEGRSLFLCGSWKTEPL
jgi:hypothetical protein